MKRYLELKPEHKDFLRKRESKSSLDENQLFIVEFGRYYGWGGVKAILADEITLKTAQWLLDGARRMENKDIYNLSLGSYIGTGAINSKNPSQQFQKFTKDLEMRLQNG